jgi:hypothetical protein
LSTDVVDVELTFDDSAAAPLPDSSPITSGTYLPTNYVVGDTFPAPAPAPSAATMLATFNSTDPNGTWNLYINDDVGGDLGDMDGWCLQIETAGGPTPTSTATATNTPIPTATSTNTPVPTATATNTPEPTVTATNTPGPSPTATATTPPTGVELSNFGGQSSGGSFVIFAAVALFGLALAFVFLRRPQKKGE